MDSLKVYFPQDDPKFRAQASSIAAGAVTFGGTLALSTTLQKFIGVSTGTTMGILRPIPSLFGLATVCLASMASHKSSLAMYKYSLKGEDPFRRRRQLFAAFSHYEEQLDLRYMRIPVHTATICLSGLLLFKILGGRFWAIAPSSYTTVGSFARFRAGNIPAGVNYAHDSQRRMIEQLGSRFGCHTCGSKMTFSSGAYRFVADHQPPKAVAKQMEERFLWRLFRRKAKFRFYPQCTNCSPTQGATLSKAANAGLTNLQASGGGRKAFNHGLRPRLNHLTGGIMGGIAVVGANEADLIDENRYRYSYYRYRVQDFVDRSLRDIKSYFKK